MQQTASFKRFDWLLLGTALVLSCIGIVLLWGIVRWEPKWHRLPTRQVQWLLLSLCVMTVVVAVDYRFWRRFAWPAYGLTMLLLLLLPVFGHTENYSTRWYRLGPVSVQPSEFTKVAFVLLLAHVLTWRRSIRSFGGLVLPFVLALAPMALILTQPDLGTALLFLPTLFVMLFVAGARPKHLIATAVAGLTCAPLLWLRMGPSQRGRILGFIWPEQDPFGSGWHVTRSVAATIAGGATGNGFSSGAPILLHRGFKAFNDFIFAAASYELGFVGSMSILFLYFVFFSRGTAIAAATRDPFARLLAAGMLTMLATQTLINIGMTIRLCPITGMTLPFMSQGGSSLLTCFIMIGFLLNVSLRRPTVIARTSSE